MTFIYLILLRWIFLISCAFYLFFFCCYSFISFSFMLFFLDISFIMFFWLSLKLLIYLLVCSKLFRSLSRIYFIWELRKLWFFAFSSAIRMFFIYLKIRSIGSGNSLSCSMSILLNGPAPSPPFYFTHHLSSEETGCAPACPALISTFSLFWSATSVIKDPEILPHYC